MKGDKAVELFKAYKNAGMLPDKIEDLVPVSFMGQLAVSFYRSTIQNIDKLNMTEAQRQATLKDGQNAGEMLLEIEKRIGEIVISEKPAKLKARPIKGPNGILIGSKNEPSGKPPKHERLGLKERHMKAAQQIAKHPEIVARVVAEAKEADDIPTKTAVVNAIKLEREKKRRKEAEAKHTKSEVAIAADQLKYINALDRCISILPTKPPVEWDKRAFKEAQVKAHVITKRLEVFDERVRGDKNSRRRSRLAR